MIFKEMPTVNYMYHLQKSQPRRNRHGNDLGNG